ncbi:protein canopy 4 [Galendromus occidentalis]|uniref:Protein canopy 4 n=1 Tax=Galendromus occidentalis TaxID=34638 RepID=A0AAJ6VVZ3_9ACAR|nr:protein canopy 4 [Galendromus occidentalis]
MLQSVLIFPVIVGLLIGRILGTENKKGEEDFVEKQYGVRYADTCEVCKYLVTELDAELQLTGKSHDVIETGYHIDTPSEKRKKKKYARSELRLIETLESVCKRLLEYRIHKERTDSTRFARGTSQTFQVLNNLVAKGVKVDLGIPKDLWDEAPAEVTNLKTQCENMLESHESDIEEWYFDESENKASLMQYLCQERVLKNDSTETKCLSEKLPVEDKSKSKEEL